MSAIELHAISRQDQESIRSVTRSASKVSSRNERAPTPRSATAVAPTKAQIVKSHVQFLTLCWTLFLAGWNDGTLGPLLPRIQSVYQVQFAVVSLIFVFACLGFVSGALLNIWLSNRVAFGKIMVFGSVMQMIAYALKSPGLPFPVLVFAYVINGIGLAIQDAQANGYVVVLNDSPETKMGILHAAYGAGAFASPLVSTQFAQLPRWSFHYLTSLCVATINTILLSAVFRFKSQDECRAEIGQEPSEKNEASTEGHSLFRQVFSVKAVHVMAFFIFIYVGTEVTIGGWIVTYIIQLRGGGPDSGYISSGFFGGLTVGRVILLPINKLIGERRAVYLYLLLAIGLELVVWLVPSLIGGAVAVSLVGVLLGPLYPIAMNVSGTVIPPWLLTAAIGWIAGFGQAGSAAFPFITGAMADGVGISSLQPLLIAMMGATMVLWGLVPRARRVD